jgi:hypothetical protein
VLKENNVNKEELKVRATDLKILGKIFKVHILTITSILFIITFCTHKIFVWFTFFFISIQFFLLWYVRIWHLITRLFLPCWEITSTTTLEIYLPTLLRVSTDFFLFWNACSFKFSLLQSSISYYILMQVWAEVINLALF